MIDLLLRHGARDDQCKALYVACRAGDEAVVSRLLALRAHVDPDHKVRKRAGERNWEQGGRMDAGEVKMIVFYRMLFKMMEFATR